jgi:hypothetical protein
MTARTFKVRDQVVGYADLAIAAAIQSWRRTI